MAWEESSAYDFLRLEVEEPCQPKPQQALKQEVKEEDTHDVWGEDDTEPLSNLRHIQELNKLSSEELSNTDCAGSSEPVHRVSREPARKVPKIKIPKVPKMKAPKKPRVLKPMFINCEICGKNVHRRKFKLHMMVHNGEKPHLCDTCGKSFTWKFALVTHKRVHSGEKPYLCKHCGQSFRSSSRFAEHSTIHTGRRSYVCEHCALAFRTSGRLKRHLRIHTGEKPYKCSFCERGFSESYNLKQHLRLHTGEKPPHVCSICTQAFIRKKMLVDHLRIHHGIMSPTAQMLMMAKQDSIVEDVGSENKMDDHMMQHSHPAPVININITFD